MAVTILFVGDNNVEANRYQKIELIRWMAGLFKIFVMPT